MKIAIIGTGKIVPTAISAMSQVPEIEITTLYGRPHSREKAESMARRYRIPHVYTDYTELLSQPDIDFVYVALTNSAHYPYCKEALSANKNVIVEKPFCSSFREAKELVELAERNHLFLFEAVTLLHMPNIRAIESDLPKLGKIRLINCNYSQLSSRYHQYLKGEIEPVFDPNLSGRALMDINVYNVNFVLYLLGKPQSIRYGANLGHNRIDTSGILTLRYPDCMAVCVGAKDSASPGYCTVQGEKGWLKVTGGPNEFTGYTLCAEGKTEEKRQNLYDNRMVHEFMEFVRIFQEKDNRSMNKFLQQSLTVMEVLDAARLEAGVPIMNFSQE